MHIHVILYLRIYVDLCFHYLHSLHCYLPPSLDPLHYYEQCYKNNSYTRTLDIYKNSLDIQPKVNIWVINYTADFSPKGGTSLHSHQVC